VIYTAALAVPERAWNLSMFAESIASGAGKHRDDTTSSERQTPTPEGDQQRGPVAEAVDFDLNLLALGAVRGIGVLALRSLIDVTGEICRGYGTKIRRPSATGSRELE
jgi:hypothetical protein